ncbi:hypothetical protein EG329_003258 [Mollisiaceae sp. DMI_Dod_QoI]|nr:hypothetical protein EG329_003258 [Helotiales sp. DMI_Dod_QoI]
MSAYLHKLRMGTGWKPGDSIACTYDALTEKLFSIEQSATVYLARSPKHEQWTVIVWLDFGEDLCDSPIGPWLKSVEAKFHTYFRHIYQHEGNSAILAASNVLGSMSGLRDTQDHSGPFQSIRLLPLSYGSSLDLSVACVEPFYALSEVFSFAAASHIEFLNTISSILDASITELPDPEADITASFQETLVHGQRILEWHVHKVSEIADMIKNRELLGWPTSKHETAVRSALFLERDFDYVLQHSRALWEKCQLELAAITNHANFTEARRAIEQENRVFRITLLASIYVPLSFSCAMFGMNFVQFDRYWHGYVVWALTACPVFFFTVLIMDLDKGRARRQLKCMFKAVVRWYRDIRD